MSRRFTLQEAESLLPSIAGDLREAIALKSEFAEAESQIKSITQRVIMLGGMLVDRSVVYQQKLRRDQSHERLKATVTRIQESGCVIKDLDIGLVDFPSLFRGEEVYLCWKLGEARIAFWHGTQEGFSGRKPIDEAFLEQHRGDAAN